MKKPRYILTILLVAAMMLSLGVGINMIPAFAETELEAAEEPGDPLVTSETEPVETTQPVDEEKPVEETKPSTTQETTTTQPTTTQPAKETTTSETEATTEETTTEETTEAEDVIKQREVEAALVQEPLYKDHQKKNRTPAYKDLTGFWKALMNRDAVVKGEQLKMTVTVSGMLPEGIQAECRYIPFDDSAIYGEQGVFFLALTLYDKTGKVFIPEEPVTVTVKSSLLKKAAADDQEPLLYSYVKIPKRAESYAKKYDRAFFAADVLAHRSKGVDSDALYYDIYSSSESYKDGEDAVRFLDDPVDLTDKGESVRFEYDYADGFDADPDDVSTDTAHFVLTVQNDNRTLHAKAGDAEITVTGAFDKGIKLEATEVTEKDPGYKTYISEAAGALDKKPSDYSFARAFDISLIDPATGKEFQPDREVEISIDLNESEESIESVDVVHFEETEKNGKTVESPEVMESQTEDNSVDFTSPGFSVYMLMGTTGGTDDTGQTDKTGDTVQTDKTGEPSANDKPAGTQTDGGNAAKDGDTQKAGDTQKDGDAQKTGDTQKDGDAQKAGDTQKDGGQQANDGQKADADAPQAGNQKSGDTKGPDDNEGDDDPPEPLCRVNHEGEQLFNTLAEAIAYIDENIGSTPATVEMLRDYEMPADDIVVIPDGLTITLKTADDYTGSGEGVATIKRTEDSADRSLITNAKATLLLHGVILDGDNVESSKPLVQSSGDLTIDTGAVLQNANSSGNGGAIASTAGDVTIIGKIRNNTAAQGGAVYYTGNGSISLKENAAITENTATGNGGAIYAAGGTVSVSADSMITGNSAGENGGGIFAESADITVEQRGTIGSFDTINNTPTGNRAKNGGGIYLLKGAITMQPEDGVISLLGNQATEGDGGGVWIGDGTLVTTGASISLNTAANGNGGAVYSDAATINITSSSILNQNSAKNGGAIYADAGTLTINGSSLTSNAASDGNGGAVYMGSGTLNLTGATMTGNTADNGSAVFVNTGRAVFAGGSYQSNTAQNGGAVGMGAASATLTFQGNVNITGNTMGSGSTASASNIYLDQDSADVINIGALGESASLGIRVSDALTSERDVPGAKFASYTSDAQLQAITNDRFGFSIETETASQKLYWGMAIPVDVRYLASYSGGMPPGQSGREVISIDAYNPVSDDLAFSQVAEDIFNTYNLNKRLTATAVFGNAFAQDATDYSAYLTTLSWDIENARWVLTKRDGTTEALGNKRLTLYYTEPAYISIENNTEMPLDISSLQLQVNSGLTMNVINSDSQVGYGMVFARDYSIKTKLLPVTADDMKLGVNESINLLIPGGQNMAYELAGNFETTTAATVPLRRSDADPTELEVSSSGAFDPFGGTTLNSDGTYRIIFGSDRSICKITDEHPFPTLTAAIEYARTLPASDPITIEMLTDYLMPADDTLQIPQGYNIIFTTATTGELRYVPAPPANPGDPVETRATISRDSQNSNSMISAAAGNANTYLTVKDLIIDGKSVRGSSDGGAVSTKNCGVTIDHVDFRNVYGGNGGAVYAETAFGAANSFVHVQNSKFTDCRSSKTGSRDGGGAINAFVEELIVEDSEFDTCYADWQAGAVFHRVDSNLTSNSEIRRCSFYGCESKAAGGMELDSKTVVVEDCSFNRCIATSRNGGALNIYALNDANPAASTGCSVEVTGCSFTDCHLTTTSTSTSTGFGGAFRSNAVTNTVTRCTFTNTSTTRYGGAITFSNTNATKAEIYGCSMDGCRAAGNGTGNGGAIYCTARELIIDDATYTDDDGQDQTVHTTILNTSSVNDGGAIYHTNTNAAASFSMTNARLQNCSVTGNNKNGGGVFTSARSVTMSGSTIRNATATGNGGGIFLNNGKDVTTTVDLTDCAISGCRANNGAGGGLYVNSAGTLTMTDCTVSGNRASGNGGGIITTMNTMSLTIEGGSIEGNTSGGQGGGVYSNSNSTLRNASITGNRLTHSNAVSAAGMYLTDGRTLTIGTAGETGHDTTTIRGNYSSSNAGANLRLPEKNNENDNKVVVNCGLSGKIYVVNAKRQGTQFGTSVISFPDGFDRSQGTVFEADDGTLFGILDRLDDEGKTIIWGADPICKITDADGNLLYFEVGSGGRKLPAVFDRLDNGKGQGNANADKTGAFSILKYDRANLVLYTKSGDEYIRYGDDISENEFYVKMLVDNYTVYNRIGTNRNNQQWNNRAWMNIHLTTASPGDTDGYPYRGRMSRATIIRGSDLINNAMITAQVSVTFENIIVDGNSSNFKPNINGGLVYCTDSQYTTIEVGKGATLQNSSVAKNGGAVFFDYGNFKLNGGIIRNCHADLSGGGVYAYSSYKTTGGPERGMVDIIDGTIYGCSAKNGGGIYEGNNPRLTITGGTIRNNQAENGAGVFVDNNATTGSFNMSGGSIINNRATVKGGGIGIGNNNNVRLYFSGKPTVSGNTLNGAACNLELDRDTNAIINTSGTGLSNGAYIGVYIPDGANLYSKHGQEHQYFGTYSTGDTKTCFYSFVNDRNGLKGGIEIENDSQRRICWVKIFSLEVSKTVLTSQNTPAENWKNETFRYRVTLSGRATATGQPDAKDINGRYGGMNFVSDGVSSTTAEFELSYDDDQEAWEKVTAENLSNGLHYEVTELMTNAQGDKFASVPAIRYTGVIGENNQAPGVDEKDWYISRILFRNMLPVCKITDSNGRLLYRRYLDSDGNEILDKNGHSYGNIPAVFTELEDAITVLDWAGETGADAHRLLYDGAGSSADAYAVSSGVQVQMLVPDYTLTKPQVINHKVTLTTASKGDDVAFPYRGNNNTYAKITRGLDDDVLITGSMFTARGEFTLRRITLDGDRKEVDINGGCVNVPSGGKLHVQTNATIQNFRAKETGNTGGYGGAVYVGSGGTFTMTGGSILNNYCENNGGAVYVGDGGRFVLSNGTINRNSCGKTVDGEFRGSGAGIYLAAGSTLEMSGSPNFGGTGISSGNFNPDTGNLTARTGITGQYNGGMYYNRERQDIFIREDAVNPASVIITGDMTGPNGSIWVWAHSPFHYETLKPFATTKENYEPDDATYRIFRDAVPDRLTGCGGEYLTGQGGDNPRFIYWSGGVDFLFMKTDGFGEGLAGATFTLYTAYTNADNNTPYRKNGTIVTATSKSGTHLGEVLFEKITPRTAPNYYYMVETDQPEGYRVNQTVYRVSWTGTGSDGHFLVEYRDESGSYKEQFKLNLGTTSKPEWTYHIMNLSRGTPRVLLRKTDTKHNSLENARFRIFRYDLTEVKNGQPAGKNYYESGDGGAFFINNLSAGRYYLRETAAPSGHGGNQGKIFILDLNPDGTYKTKELGKTSESLLGNGYIRDQILAK